MKTYEIDINFTKFEKFIRKAWLVSLLFLPITITVTFLINLFSFLFKITNILSLKDMSIFQMFCVLLLYWGLFYMNYRFTYTERGIKFLIYRLICYLPIIIGSIILVMKHFEVLTILLFSLVNWFVFLNIFLLKINLKYKKQKFSVS